MSLVRSRIVKVRADDSIRFGYKSKGQDLNLNGLALEF